MANDREALSRHPVASSAIVSVGYDAKTRTLELEFEGGAVYDYFDVPAGVYSELLEAESKGRFVNTEIKPNYRFAERNRSDIESARV